jgi:hypothetical protein
MTTMAAAADRLDPVTQPVARLSGPPRNLYLLPPVAPSNDGVPEAARIAATTAARGIAEALAGLRPVAHLAQSCDLPTYELLRRRVRWESTSSQHGDQHDVAPQDGGTRGRLRLLATHTQLVTDGIEASTTFGLNGRVRAVGFRMEPHRGRWRLVALDLG